MGGRGRERLVHCEKCGRSVRRDKAVYIEKPILQNPLDRNQMAEPSTYRAVLTREVAYCPGCGKHLRVYEKKIKQNIRNDERAARQREFGSRGPGGYGGQGGPGDFHHGPRREHPPRYEGGSGGSGGSGDGSASSSQGGSGQGSSEGGAGGNNAAESNDAAAQDSGARTPEEGGSETNESNGSDESTEGAEQNA